MGSGSLFGRASTIIVALTLSLGYAVAAETPAATGGTPAAGGKQCDQQSVLKSIESAGSGGYQAQSPNSNAWGAYQMMPPALTDIGYMKNGQWTGKNGINSLQDFKDNPAVQDSAQREYADKLWGYMKTNGAASYEGQTVNGVTMTKDVMIAGAWNPGAGGMNTYLKSGGDCSKILDKNGTCSSIYQKAMSQCSAGDQNAALDKTSKTCQTTMPMIEAINCGNFTGATATFCTQYRPFLMTRPECDAAEKYAQGAPPNGAQKTECENATFSKGTSSWSFVLACAPTSMASGAVGTSNSSQKVVGVADDPACFERLKGRTPVTNVGKVDVSSGGHSCIVPNAVKYRGTAVPLDREVTINCALAEQLENFGEKAKGMGISKIVVLGTLACRGINNAKGVGQKTTSLHGSGNAIDVSAFVANGATIETGRYKTNAQARSWLEGVKQMGCTVFDGTLAFNFYRSTSWHHIHWQATKKTSTCDPNG